MFVTIFILGLLVWLVWLDEMSYTRIHIPETELEIWVREMKMRILDAEIKFKKSIGELE